MRQNVRQKGILILCLLLTFLLISAHFVYAFVRFDKPISTRLLESSELENLKPTNPVYSAIIDAYECAKSVDMEHISYVFIDENDRTVTFYYNAYVNDELVEDYVIAAYEILYDLIQPVYYKNFRLTDFVIFHYPLYSPKLHVYLHYDDSNIAQESVVFYLDREPERIRY